MHFAHARVADDLRDVLCAHARAGDHGDAALRLFLRAADPRLAEQRIRCETRSQHARDLERDEFFERLLWIAHEIERAMERDRRASGGADDRLHASAIDGAVGQQAAGDDAVGAVLQQQVEILAHDEELVLRVEEVAAPRPQHRDDRNAHGGADGAQQAEARSEPAFADGAAEFDAMCARGFGFAGAVDGIGDDFDEDFGRAGCGGRHGAYGAAMRPQLLHLSGPLRGRTVTYDDDALVVGSAEAAELRLEHDAVAPLHAMVEWHEEDCSFVLRRIDGRIFVNREEVEAVTLHDDDLIEWGIDGPRSRFRAYVSEGAVCKPVRKMLKDARDVKHNSGGVAAASGFTRDLFTQATMQLKVGFPLLVLALVLPLSWFAGWLGAKPAREWKPRADEVTTAELDRMRSVLAAQQAELERLQRASAVFSKVQKQLSRGVGLVHGIAVVRLSDGEIARDYRGRQLRHEFTGSGFLASADGRVLTNRHVVTPWENVPDMQAAIERGGVAAWERLTMTFPGKSPATIDPETIRRRKDELDVALFRLPVGTFDGVPVLPLHEGPLSEMADPRAIVVGYPTGIAALLAKADSAVVDRLREKGADLADVISELAGADRISPLITEGRIGNVQDQMIVYDAPTTHGGSGGPVIGSDGEVVAVNYAVLRDFSGANFGVPIVFGKELLVD